MSINKIAGKNTKDFKYVDLLFVLSDSEHIENPENALTLGISMLILFIIKTFHQALDRTKIIIKTYQKFHCRK